MSAAHTTGTITLTNGSPNIVGVGTTWQTGGIVGGMVFPLANGNVLPIASVQSNTQMTAAVPWIGATGTYQYALVRDTAYLQQITANAELFTTIVTEMRYSSISALGALAAPMTADKFAYTTGVNTMAWASLSAFCREMLALGDAAAVRNKIGAFSTGGGTLNGSVIVTGSLGVSNIVQAAGLYVDNAAGATSMTNYRTGTAVRWAMGRTSTAESGSNDGSNLTIDRFGDGANYLGSPLTISRRTGIVETRETPFCAGTPYAPIIGVNSGQSTGLLRDAVGFDFNRGFPGFSAGGNSGVGGRVVHVPHTAWYMMRVRVTFSGSGGKSMALTKNGVPLCYVFHPGGGGTTALR